MSNEVSALDMAAAAKQAADWNAVNPIGTRVRICRLVDGRFERMAVTTSAAIVNETLGALVHVDGGDPRIPYMIDCLTAVPSQPPAPVVALPPALVAGAYEAPPFCCRTRTATASIANHRVHLAVADYPDGRPCRIRVDVHKEGSGYRGLMDAFASTASEGLQRGVPLHVYVDDWRGRCFEPNGATDDPAVPTATSILDWIARTLEAEYPEHARVAQPAEAPPVAHAVELAVAAE